MILINNFRSTVRHSSIGHMKRMIMNCHDINGLSFVYHIDIEMCYVLLAQLHYRPTNFTSKTVQAHSTSTAKLLKLMALIMRLNEALVLIATAVHKNDLHIYQRNCKLFLQLVYRRNVYISIISMSTHRKGCPVYGKYNNNCLCR